MKYVRKSTTSQTKIQGFFGVQHAPADELLSTPKEDTVRIKGSF